MSQRERESKSMEENKKKIKGKKENEMKFASLDSFNLPPFGVLSTERERES